MSDAKEEVWGIVELMGHVRLAGRVSEEEKFGSKLGRIDIPTEERCKDCNPELGEALSLREKCEACGGTGFVRCFLTQYFGGGSIYRFTIVTEAVARHVAKSNVPQPVNAWDFPKQLTAKAVAPTRDTDLYGDDDSEDDREF